jgi:hypothetical protein
MANCCQGTPSGPCPDSCCDATVRYSIYDVFVCPSCDQARADIEKASGITVVTKKATTNSQIKAKTKGVKKSEPSKTINKTTKNDQSKESPSGHNFTSIATSAEITVDSELKDSDRDQPQAGSDGHPQQMDYCTLVTELAQLKDTVTKQNDTILSLSNKLNFVLSYLEIDNSVILQPANRPSFDGSQLPTISKPSYASITARLAADSASVQRPSTEDAVAAVYVDIAKKSKRESNFIVSGILPSSSLTDRQQVYNLCSSEFDVQPDIVHVKRLGRSVIGKTQPLLVVVRQASEAQRLIRMARDLRQSTNQEVKNNVYINPNLTSAEAAAAFQLRAERRSSNQRRHENANGRNGHSTLKVSASNFIPLSASSGRPV